MSADGTPAGGFAYPESAARALGLAARRAAWLRRPRRRATERSIGIDRRRCNCMIADALPASDDVWLEPAGRSRAARRIRPAARRRALRGNAGRRARCGSRDRLSRRRQDGCGRRAQDRVGRGAPRPPRRRQRRARVRRDRRAGDRAAVRHGGGRAARRRDPGSGLRAARRLRAGRRVRRVDRLDEVRARAPDEIDVGRADLERQGGTPRRGLAGCGTGRPCRRSST